MTVSSQPRSKYAAAVFIAGGVALACLDRVSPVGVMSVGGRDMRITSSLSKHQIMEWLHRLRRFRYDEPTTLGRRIAELSPSLSAKALVVVLSDLHDQRAIPALRQLAQQHDVVILQLQDPAEVNLRESGFFRGREAETGREFVSHGRQVWLDQTTVDEELKRRGIDHLLIHTGRPYAQRLRHFFASRNLLGRMPR